MTHFYFLFFKLIIKCTCFSLSKALGREHHRKPIVSTPTVYLNSCLCDVHSALLFTLADSLSPMSCCKNDTASPQPPAPEDLSIVCFTSGTTGTAQHLTPTLLFLAHGPLLLPVAITWIKMLPASRAETPQTFFLLI